MSRTSALERLQSIDLEIDDRTKRARLIDELLGTDPAVVVARAGVEKAEKHLAEVRANLRDRELEGRTLDAKIKGIEDRLYGGQVSNPKELDGLEKEIQMFKRLRSDLDDRQLELMDTIEQEQKRLAQQAGALKQMEGTREIDVEQLARERNALAARLAGLGEERESTRASVDEDTLRTYERLRQNKARRAVATIRQNACGLCGVAVPTGHIQRVHTGNELVFCSGCGRILAG